MCVYVCLFYVVESQGKGSDLRCKNEEGKEQTREATFLKKNVRERE